MPYVSQSRDTGRPVQGYLGQQVGTTGETWSHYDTFLPGRQVTNSWRTGPDWDELEEDQEVLDFLRTTRNGFTQQSIHDNGHTFRTSKQVYRFSHPREIVFGKTTGSFSRLAYKGPLVLSSAMTNSDRANRHWADPAITDPNKVREWGSTLINKAIPTRPGVSLATTLGEIFKEGLPAIVGGQYLQERSSRFRALGGEYLNVEFGWLPFIRDVQKIVEQLMDASRIISNYERDSGRVVRRRRFIPTDVKSTFTVGTTDGIRESLTFLQGYSVGFQTAQNSGVPRTLEETITRDVWFSGAFQYYLPDAHSVTGKLARYEALGNRLLGTRITPEVLWNLSPWSWLVDWFSTIGIVISNAEQLSSDNLVMRYGYLMCQTRHVRTYRTLRPLIFINNKTLEPRCTFITETKERFRGTPYGFSIDLATLSPRQWAILGALGLTRGPRSLP